MARLETKLSARTDPTAPDLGAVSEHVMKSINNTIPNTWKRHEIRERTTETRDVFR